MASNLINTLIKTLDVRSNPKSIYSKLDYVPKERLISEAVNKGFTDENDVIRYVAEKIKNSPKPKSYDHFKVKTKNPDKDLSIASTRQSVREQADQILLDDANDYMVELENELRSGRSGKFVPLDRLENYLDLKSSSLADDDDTMNYARTLLRQIEDSDRFAKEDFEAMMKEFGERETTSLMNDPHAVAEAQQNLDIFEKELDYFNKNYGSETPLDKSNIFKKRLKEGTQKSINDYRLNNHGYYPSNEEQNTIRQNVYKNLTKQATKKKDINEYGITPEKAEINRRNKIFADNQEKVNELTDIGIGNDELLDELTRLYIKDNYKSAEWIDKSLPPKSKTEMDKQYTDYRTDVWKQNPDTKKGILKDYKETIKNKKQDQNYIGSKAFGQDRQKFIKRLDDLDRFEQMTKQKELNPFEISNTSYNTQTLNLSEEQKEILNLLEDINNQPKTERYLDNMFGNKENYNIPKTDTIAGHLINKQETLKRSSPKLVNNKKVNKQIRKINQKERLNILQDKISNIKQEKQDEFMLRAYLYSLLSDINL